MHLPANYYKNEIDTTTAITQKLTNLKTPKREQWFVSSRPTSPAILYLTKLSLTMDPSSAETNASSLSIQTVLCKWKFDHFTSSLGNTKVNSKAESAVKTAKRLMRKAADTNADPYLALLDY